MKTLNVLGIDPGFKFVGWAVVTLTAGAPDTLRACGVLETEQSDKKRAVLAVEDNVRRAREVAAFLARLCSEHQIIAICAEAMSFPRNASSAAKVAMCWGAIATLSELRQLPIIQASPQEIKRILCKKKDASKEEVAAVIRTRYGRVPDQLLSSLAASKHEHAFDAAASVVAALETNETIRAIRKATA